jgi:hypothetical protein
VSIVEISLSLSLISENHIRFPDNLNNVNPLKNNLKFHVILKFELNKFEI